MTKSAYDRASRILVELRERILERLPQGSSDEKYCNKKIKELYDELDMICRKTHTEFFEYVYKSLGIELAEGIVIALNTRKNARVMHSEINIAYGCVEYQTFTWKEEKTHAENLLISQAREWLKSNRESLSSVTLQEPETISGHDIQLPDNPTRKQIAKYFIELTGKGYQSRTIEAYICRIEQRDEEIEPITRKKQPYRYDNAVVAKIILLLHEEIKGGRK